MTKLWGREEGVGGFYRNDQLTAAVNEEILEQGDPGDRFYLQGPGELV